MTIVVTSFVSRALRSTELRITEVELSPEALCCISEDPNDRIRIIAHAPRVCDESTLIKEFDRIEALVRSRYGLRDEPLYFLEVRRSDASDFEQILCVENRLVGNHQLLYAKSPVVANAIAAFLIHLERTTGHIPHAYFKWKEGNPVANILRYIFLGEGDAAPITHEVLRRAISNPDRRPIIHVS